MQFLNGSPSLKSTLKVPPNGTLGSALNTPRGSIIEPLNVPSDTQSTKKVPILPKKTSVKDKKGTPSFIPDPIEILDHNVIEKVTERELTDKLRKEFFRRKA
jgi:hypothetical protein